MSRDNQSTDVLEIILALSAIAIVLSSAIFIVVALLSTDAEPEERCIKSIVGEKICRTQTIWEIDDLGEPYE